jgi:hypothetical protein
MAKARELQAQRLKGKLIAAVKLVMDIEECAEIVERFPNMSARTRRRMAYRRRQLAETIAACEVSRKKYMKTFEPRR